MTLPNNGKLDKKTLEEVEQLENQYNQYFTYNGAMDNTTLFKQVSLIDYSLPSYTSSSTEVINK